MVIVRYKIDPELPLVIVDPFTISNIETGCTEFTGFNTVDISNLPDPVEIEGVTYNRYQITESDDSDSLDPNAWKPFDEPLTQESFAIPVSDGTVTLYAWYTHDTDSVPLQRASGEIVYTTIAPPEPLMVDPLARVTAGYTVRVTAESLDAGSTGGVYEGRPIGIYRRYAVDPAGESNNLTPDTTYFTVDGVGAYPVRLKVVNMAGNVTTSSVSRALEVVSTTDLPSGEPGDLFVAAGNLHADDQEPYASWATAAATIQDAVDAASGESPSTIWVAPEVYYGGGEWHLPGGLGNVVDITKPIHLRGAADRNTVFIDGYGLRRGVRIAHAGAVVEGLTVTNGFVVAGGGGGVLITVTGGTLRDCVVGGNRADDSSGGGVFATGPNTLVDNCDIIGNSSGQAHTGAGGIHVGNQALATGCLIAGNAGTGSAGGVRVEGSANGETLVVNSRILNNTATASNGGGLDVRRSAGNPLTAARNCLIAGNTPNGVSISARGTANVLENCTIVANSGRGIYKMWWEGVNTVMNSIVYHNTDDTPRIDGGALYFTNSCVNVANIAVLDGSGNINDNPLFVDSAAGNFRLRSGSPCINSGTNLPWMVGAVDLDGKRRIDGVSGLIDMGAYEFIQQSTILLVR